MLYVIRESSVTWEDSFKKRSCPSKEVQFRSLLSLFINVFICRNDKDESGLSIGHWRCRLICLPHVPKIH